MSRPAHIAGTACVRALFLALGLAASGSAWAISVGDAAPELSATLLDGRGLTLSQLHGDVVVIDFWASWCAPCLAELQALRGLTTRYGVRGLAVIAINMDDPADRAKARAIDRDLPFARSNYEDVDARGYGRIWRLPMLFVIDRAGTLRVDGSSGPPQEWDEQSLNALLASLLAQQQ